ncbi:Arsenical resistance operon trans-acting repressor ArsD [Caloramator quimbayensis]|uniref:Arsenical resistance operon trans-acting repressor ArsD n=1 Tax=Caloramator quimbayensis TaxID=1147123 RepID=A0A1T4YFY0_9CLOT|nr:arsenite efflux transporter metallochaperone ArsD [Caloramator quimbayensis]SKB00674.1 Arsenical resistance operon trans-acting repressor ArsD [Caloramator quimbayensis]
MKKITIYEPAMCCPTGLCGVSIDPDLLRISTVLNNLKKKGIEIERYNLTNSPMKFMTNKTVNKMINEKGIDELPFTLVDEEVAITGRYPTNEELADFLGIPINSFDEESKIDK